MKHMSIATTRIASRQWRVTPIPIGDVADEPQPGQRGSPGLTPTAWAWAVVPAGFPTRPARGFSPPPGPHFAAERDQLSAHTKSRCPLAVLFAR